MCVLHVPAFASYIGIDYSGAQTPTAGLTGIRVYRADASSSPTEVLPPANGRKHWTRRGLAEWLLCELASDTVALVGMDHAFSFPLQYFETHRLPLDWPAFLDDFCHHWPTDEDDVRVELVRRGSCGKGLARTGNARWRRIADVRAHTAKSVFHFDVQGSVAKSTHAGLPWLRFLRRELGPRVHFWPFDGWTVPAGRTCMAEVYPSLWKRIYPAEARSADQHDAFSVAAKLRDLDVAGELRGVLDPTLTAAERAVAAIEGWIVGVS
jgi:hypothetical protein